MRNYIVTKEYWVADDDGRESFFSDIIGLWGNAQDAIEDLHSRDKFTTNDLTWDPIMSKDGGDGYAANDDYAYYFIMSYEVQ